MMLPAGIMMYFVNVFVLVLIMCLSMVMVVMLFFSAMILLVALNLVMYGVCGLLLYVLWFCIMLVKFMFVASICMRI